MKKMDLPDSQTFFQTVESVFSFLRPAGFEFPASGKESRSTFDAIRIMGKNVAFELSLDRRDQCVDFYIARVKDGRVLRNDVPGGYWRHFHSFLVERRNYRGGFSEFEDASQKDEVTSTLVMYGNALGNLAPDAAADSEDVFG